MFIGYGGRTAPFEVSYLTSDGKLRQVVSSNSFFIVLARLFSIVTERASIFDRHEQKRDKCSPVYSVSGLNIIVNV